MLKLWIPVVAVLVLSSLAFGGSNPKLSGGAAARPADDTCAFTFTSGAGHGLTQYCVTANGNIAQFSAADSGGTPQEFLNLVAPATEGYGFCDVFLGTLTPYWDYASGDSGNWNPATAVSTPTSVTITRTTADGVWQLVQTITEMKGSPKKFGAARIDMVLTNLSIFERGLVINRHAHIQSFFNDNNYDATASTVFGRLSGTNGNGLASAASFVTTKNDFSLPPLVMTIPDGPNPCQDFGQQGGQHDFFRGDGAIDQQFSLDIMPHKTKTITVTYEPF